MAEHQALYSMEMALKSYRSTIEVHREGKAYKDMMEFETNSLYDIENFCVDNESNLPLRHRFLDVPWNVPMDSKDDADDNIQ